MQVEQSVLSVLSAAQATGNAVVLTGQLDRKLYEKTNKVLEAAGGKWNRKARAHVFDGDAADRLDQIILTGHVEVPKDEFNFFPTPPDVIRVLLDLADVQPGMAVLEPSAGHGAIAKACADIGAHVDCIELMAANAVVLRSDDRLCVREVDFLSVPVVQGYDRAVMNPPFLKQADIKHVSHAHLFLKPGGLLVAVMSAGVRFRENKLTTDFRTLVEQRGGSISALPDASFKSSGTMVNTVVVTIPA
ncbi:Uncharacterised protein [Achromobacter sp. 2789STDY5608615]|uniref:restriction endonuclease subunit M n=1 Tax=Achromobacter sp. 2789STDY5608615 TaxID=1806492 RepID=UPI0006C0D0AE|nr:restriction endonuclease subunit M [Achromobacter sp. 2789STDY5608615]CUJ98094.1 Uncharacterised protein [Achromobacter sp. 2789STDY5608615]